MTKQTFAEYMARLAAAFPQSSASPETLAVYWERLREVDDAVFAAAVMRVIDTREWFPSVAGILKEVDAILTEAGLLPAGEPQAWGMVFAAVAGDGKIEDELVRVVLRRFGLLRDLKNMTVGDVHRMEDRFRKTYREERDRYIRENPWLYRMPIESKPDALPERSLTEALAALEEGE